MATITVKVPRQIAWGGSDLLEVYKGSENAASLAASTPTGGTLVAEAPAWGGLAMRGGFGFSAGGFGMGAFGLGEPAYGFGLGEFGFGEFGIHDAPRVSIPFVHNSVDKCCTLPVGVKVRDEAGNRSTVDEETATIADPPRGARNLRVSATANPLEALLEWDASPDL